MKKKLIFTALMSVFSISLFVVSLKANMTDSPLLMENVESLSEFVHLSHGGDIDINESVIECRCSAADLFRKKECLAAFNGNRCAQSRPGENIKCQDWNSNCGAPK